MPPTAISPACSISCAVTRADFRASASSKVALRAFGHHHSALETTGQLGSGSRDRSALARTRAIVPRSAQRPTRPRRSRPRCLSRSASNSAAPRTIAADMVSSSVRRAIAPPSISASHAAGAVRDRGDHGLGRPARPRRQATRPTRHRHHRCHHHAQGPMQRQPSGCRSSACSWYMPSSLVPRAGQPQRQTRAHPLPRTL